ncbi:MAG: PA2169 family four-helix-bundle protein [Betaproteobacteria bacterium]
MENNEVVDILNDLIETSKDGEYGFTACAERATSAELRQIFSRRAADCASGAQELQALVVQYGGKAEDSGTVAGAMHRGWVSVRDAVSGNSDQAILDECERGEDVALGRYRKTMKQADLPVTVLQAVERQMAGVQANHDQIKTLRDTLRANS